MNQSAVGAAHSLVDRARPINDRVIIRLKPVETKTPGGLFIPDVAQDGVEHMSSMVRYSRGGVHEGTVIAAGPGTWMETGEYRRPMSVKAGDRVLFGQFADFGEEGIAVIREDDILAIIV
jgi:chaperonin GroES